MRSKEWGRQELSAGAFGIHEMGLGSLKHMQMRIFACCNHVGASLRFI